MQVGMHEALQTKHVGSVLFSFHCARIKANSIRKDKSAKYYVGFSFFFTNLFLDLLTFLFLSIVPKFYLDCLAFMLLYPFGICLYIFIYEKCAFYPRNITRISSHKRVDFAFKPPFIMLVTTHPNNTTCLGPFIIIYKHFNSIILFMTLPPSLCWLVIKRLVSGWLFILPGEPH